MSLLIHRVDCEQALIPVASFMKLVRLLAPLKCGGFPKAHCGQRGKRHRILGIPLDHARELGPRASRIGCISGRLRAERQHHVGEAKIEAGARVGGFQIRSDLERISCLLKFAAED